MRLLPAIIIANALLVAPGSTAPRGDDGDAARDRAIAAIVAAGGSVSPDPRGAGVPIRSVTLVNANDALMGHTSTLTEVTELLVVSGNVSPAGWEALRRLVRLDHLVLRTGPPIPD